MIKQATVRITKDFRFEMAHALKGYDGLCRNIHGHTYELKVTIAGKPIIDEKSPKLGMVMDFGDLKKIVKEEIVNRYDHALVLYNKMPDGLLAELKKNFERVILKDYNPTSELMLIDFVEVIKKRLPENVTLKHMFLRETTTSYAEWYAEDNEN
ncbi:6-carboxytetrahydropterin synthase [Candidatus Sulfidibacterium hydrothermale]|uniref:6-pyruvoyl trahydropterin synthase family protein n=1 Tax=Candidatus Sulfidibacterium hydrothermale TaxID=2875962 RepID=UPI001F0B6596|nr:6-carboxytetrahydropterin synthase [Candidatus Sulfidibacterium hydrothermale]UBM62306.1 6-carboxytetrahydropterin synthase [Candidatus Sulfidibacterium hydrothermale]